MIIESSELNKIRAMSSGAQIVLRIGCYDLLHQGHVAGIELAKRLGGILVVGVLSDEAVRQRKGPSRPINPEGTRVATIDSLPGVDYSFIAPESTLSLAEVFQRLRPDVFVELEEGRHHGWLKEMFVRAMGSHLVVDQGYKIDSTSDMIERLGVDGASEQSALFVASVIAGNASAPEALPLESSAAVPLAHIDS